MKNEYVGFTQGFHTESLAILDDNGSGVFYPRGFDPSVVKTDNIAFFERPYLKKTRQFAAGQYKTAFSKLNLKLKPKKYFPHHLCHAANAFQQSSYEHATVIVADSIGEWETLSVWFACYDEYGYSHYKKLHSEAYPMSLGLFYSAITQRLGLKPNAQEKNIMFLSVCGTPQTELVRMMIDNIHNKNFHRGCGDMYPNYKNEDIAASAQRALEAVMSTYLCYASFPIPIMNKMPICMSGGVAFNSFMIDNFRKRGYNIFVPENPGDPGSAIGAAALLYRKRICSMTIVTTKNNSA
jgi:carbamoyltransferase